MIDVEADAASGLPAFTIVGLPDAALGEARDRVRAAISNSGLPFTLRRLTVNLQPANLPKTGTTFDLAIAVAVLTSSDLLPERVVRRVVHIGELGLDGRVRPVRGVLPAVLAASRAGLREVVVARANATEARLVDGVEVRPVGSLAELVGIYRGEPVPELLLADLHDLDEQEARDEASTARSAEPDVVGPQRLPVHARSATYWTWPMWPARRRPGGRWRWRQPVAITCSWWGRRVPARPCWPLGCRACCRTWSETWRSRSPPCTRSWDWSRATAG